MKNRQRDTDDQDNAKPQGEGNYRATRRHRESVESFVASDRVDAAARKAAPRNQAEARQLEAAEQPGKAHARH
jgi:hypothetical protein